MTEFGRIARGSWQTKQASFEFGFGVSQAASPTYGTLKKDPKGARISDTETADNIFSNS